MILVKHGKNLLESLYGWKDFDFKECLVNNGVVDTAQGLVCKSLGVKKNASLFRNVKNKLNTPSKAIDNGHIQLLHNRKNHSLLTFCSSGQVCFRILK